MSHFIVPCTVIADIFVRVKISYSSVCELSYSINFRTANTLSYVHRFRMLLNFVLSAESTKSTKSNAATCCVFCIYARVCHPAGVHGFVSLDLSSHLQPLESEICKSFSAISDRQTHSWSGCEGSACASSSSWWIGYREAHRRLHQGARLLEGHLPVTDDLDNQAGSRLGRRLLGHQEAKEGSSRSAHEIHLRDGSKCDTYPSGKSAAGRGSRNRSGCFTLADSPAPAWKPTDLLYPKEPLGNPYAFDMGGQRPICRYTVHAESRSSPTMRSLVAQDHGATMKCAT